MSPQANRVTRFELVRMYFTAVAGITEDEGPLVKTFGRIRDNKNDFRV
jgi:hypothetical protein